MILHRWVGRRWGVLPAIPQAPRRAIWQIADLRRRLDWYRLGQPTNHLKGATRD